MTDIPPWWEGPLPDRICARVIADSIAPTGQRLTTFECRYNRYFHSEVLTHTILCLAGDSVLEFELPYRQKNGSPSRYRMTITEFADKWHNGARRMMSRPKRELSTESVDIDTVYTASDLAHLTGLSSSVINKACRQGDCQARKEGRNWLIQGSEFLKWRSSSPAENRYDMSARLERMRIRQLDERTGLVKTSRVVNCFESGTKPVYEVRAGRFHVAGSANHRVLTPDGWTTIGELNPGDSIVVKRHGKREEDLLDPARLQIIGGRWRQVWQRHKRQELLEAFGGCQGCTSTKQLSIHHTIPVHVDPSLAFEDSNVELLCHDCHKIRHKKQGWQGGRYLYGGVATVDSVEFRGVEPTFDLEIAGEFPNFLANGVVVHNSRNSASSRAIPYPKLRKQIAENPAGPTVWAANQPGMQGGAEIDDVEEAQDAWLTGRDSALTIADHLNELGIHKSIPNRIIEPWMFITVTITGVDWEGFFNQRSAHRTSLVLPEFGQLAAQMEDLYNWSIPAHLDKGEWHLPYLREFELRDDLSTTRKVSVARCARTSYLTHTGVRDINEDVKLYERLIDASPQHASPFNQIATPAAWNEMTVRIDPQDYGCDGEIHELRVPIVGNTRGWLQFRHIDLGW